jgi:hypothetical protein
LTFFGNLSALSYESEEQVPFPKKKHVGMLQDRLEVRLLTPHYREVFPTELASDEEMERGPGKWRRINVM